MLHPSWVKYLCKFSFQKIMICKNTTNWRGKEFDRDYFRYFYWKFPDYSFFQKYFLSICNDRGFLGFFEKFLGTRNTRRRFGLNGKWWDLRMGESDPEGGTRRRKEGGPLWKDRLSFAKALKRLRRRSN